MPEQRRDPTLGTWCVISGERGHRPLPLVLPTLSPVSRERCPFCPGNEAATTATLMRVDDDDGHWLVRAFPNRYPALRVEGEVRRVAVGPFDRSEGIGAHEVIVETPHHDRPIWRTPGQSLLALQLARARHADLARDHRLVHLGWFRNHGALAGASQPHPHAQVLGSAEVPRLTGEMSARCAAHRQRTGRDLLSDVLDLELDSGVRLLGVSQGVAAFCAFAPRFPFEVWVVPISGGPRFYEASDEQLGGVATLLDQVLPALMHQLDQPDHNVVLYSAPVGGEAGFRWHLRLTPRLVALGGYEISEGGTIIHAAPEEAASVLREAMREDQLTSSGPNATTSRAVPITASGSR